MKRVWVGLMALAALAACGEDTSPALAPGADVGGQGDDAGLVDVGPDDADEGADALAPDGALADTGGEEIEEPDAPQEEVSRAREQLDWVLSVINGPARVLSVGEVEEHFAPQFLNQVPADDLIEIMGQLRSEVAPLRVDGVLAEPDPFNLSVRAEGPRDLWFRITVATERATPFRMVGLLFEAAPQFNPNRPADFEELAERIGAAALRSNFLAAEIVDGRCEPVGARAADRALALGSTFKLYILGALADRIEAGEMGWEDELAIQEARKSLPSGRLHQEPEGTLLTLEEMAGLMISISDNTATDHLLFHLGRGAVEDFQAEMGHGAPALNTPFLSTRELFLLKGALTRPQALDYIALDAEGRRAFLDGELAGRSLREVRPWSFPTFVDELEWFASPEDLCGAMSSLKLLSEAPGGEPVAQILSINPGIPFDAQAWPFIGFKGGSEPGVLNLTWLLRREDERWFFLTLGLVDPSAPIDEAAAINLAGFAALLLAEVP